MSVVNKITRRMQNIVTKVLVKAVYDSDQIQLVKISGLYDEVTDKVERIQNYGLTSNPPQNSEGVSLCLSGDKDHQIVIACDSGVYRVQVENGEVAIYSQYGQKILLAKNGNIETTQNIFSVGTGASNVTIANKNDLLWQKLYTVFSTWVPPISPTIDNGASLKTAFQAAFGSGPGSTGSSNLKAD
jgi:phage baseplate assembly protein V